MNNNETVLVTGGTGFVGMRIILQLLQKGFHVRTTMRDLKSKDKLIQTLRNNGITDVGNLSFIQAELTKDDHWEEAMRGCTYVMSVASPVFFGIPKNEEEAIRPAVEGILRILKFAKFTDVQRVIMTSNFGAVGFSHTDKKTQTTEADWTDPNLKGLSVYEKSKTLAEKAAWDFIKNEGSGLEFCTVNPVAILGPSMDAHVSGSFMLIDNLVNGKMKAIPELPLNIVDVRDVADLHIRAMLKPEAAGERFIATADGQISWPQIAALIRKKTPQLSEKVSSKKLSGWVISLASLFNEKAKEGKMFMQVNRNVSNAKAKNILGWSPISTQEEAILAAVDSMKKYGLIS